ncbi:MAG TPA: superinfection immunity protein [Candidatus Angelobacter sp.]|nr:superinfection immunity protein [Candidatus Angelobacter sp.]
MAILIVNCLFGWTIVGWVIALIWACNDNREPAPGAQLQARSY